MSETEIVRDCMATLERFGFAIPRVLMMRDQEGKKRRVTVWTEGKRGRCWRANTGATVSFSATGKRNFTAFGVPGQPDIVGWSRELVLWNGTERYRAVWFAVECKDGYGKQSEAQIEFEKRLYDDGGIYILVRSAEELERELRTRGIAP